MFINNHKGERLFMVVVSNSKEFDRPFISLMTEEKAVRYFNTAILERNDESWYVKQIKIVKNGSYMKALLHCNNKGWGGDFFQSIKIEPAYCN